MSITEDMIQESGDQALVKLAADPSHGGSCAALWMLLLLRLTSVAADQRPELRNSKFSARTQIRHETNVPRRYPNPDADNICIWREPQP